jgi:hypothetical protein
LEFAGGGVVPIVGCAGNTAADLHHGPDKSTLNNEVGINLHRICEYCHNRWHELNDEYYGDRPADNMNYVPTDREVEPHDRVTRADRQVILANEKWFLTPKSERPKYREWKLRELKTRVEETSSI